MPLAVALLIPGLVLLVLALTLLPLVLAWRKARGAGLPITVGRVLRMRLLRIDPAVIVDACIVTRRSGLDISPEQFEALRLAQGHPAAVARALAAAKQAGIAMSFERACAIDLAKRDVEAAVHGAIHPRDVAMPAVDAASSDGYSLTLAASVRLRTCLERLVGGAPEATVLARIGQAIVDEVATCDHRMVDLERTRLVERILARDLARDCGCTVDGIAITTVTVTGPVASRA